MGDRIIKTAGLVEKFKYWLGKRTCFKVKGNSMNPLIKDGEVVYAEEPSNLKVGDIVIANHPFKKSVIMLKQIQRLEKTRAMLSGINTKESTDSRQLGLIRISDIVGRVTSKDTKA